MDIKIINPSINNRTIIEILNARDKHYAERLYRQLIYLLTNTHYIEEDELINDCFSVLKLGLYLNSESIYFSNVNFIVFMERKFRKIIEEDNEIFFSKFCDIMTYIDELIEKETDKNDKVNLQQFKTRLITLFRKQHIKFMNK